MQRRNAIKALAFSAMSPQFLLKNYNNEGVLKQFKKMIGVAKKSGSFASQWNEWPDMEWAGPSYWGNRLQDWQIRDGQLQCSVRNKNRTLHCLTHQLSDEMEIVESEVNIELPNQTASDKDYIGFRLGAKGKFDDYRSAAVFGEGLDVGITTNGRLFMGKEKSSEAVSLPKTARLRFKATPSENGYHAEVSVYERSNDKLLDRLTTSNISNKQLTGNIALVSHFISQKEETDQTSVLFSDWILDGGKVIYHPEQSYGPICFAQYTLDKKTLKLTAQLAPVEAIADHEVSLQVKQGYRWSTIQTTTLHPLARTAQFRIEPWKYTQNVPYRITLELPMKAGTKTYHYEGTIAENPVSSKKLKTAVFSCNSHYGFPNTEVVKHVDKHEADMAVFLGDQFYESHGGFGVQRSPLEKACLDYLRKWYMFGWSYRDIFRHIPCAIIPDDHDVYHGNVWGAGGKEAPTDEGWGYVAQDQGGYKMPAEWVNVVQRTQTSNLPDPYDPTPVKQDISVYYTDWNYGGVSFAILEDRKFKSAPKNVLPEEAQVKNGFIQNRDFDITKYYDIDATLLGERQLDFLEHWSADWGDGAQMKAVFSQTNFCTVATLPEGSIIDSMVPGLEIPRPGTYVKGDAPTSDMDSNGWPQKGRDKALRRIRKCFALHIAGDQHLASTVHYGVDEFADAGYAFAGPALNNVWPRRWWPPVKEEHQPLAGQPKNTGNFKDGFDNHMTVYGVANPVQTNRSPAIIYDRATGYGMVTFDKTERTMRIECWPRYVDPMSNPEGQYDGWPVVIRQEDNYGRRTATYLPKLQIEGMADPVVQVYQQDTNELVYALRIKGQSFLPKVFERKMYIIRVGEPDQDSWREFEDVSPSDEQPIVCKF